MRFLIFCLLVCATFFLSVSCRSNFKLVEQKSPFGPSGIPPQLQQTNIRKGPDPALLRNITPQEDIVFTDPDDPDAGIPELEVLMAAPKRGPWEKSFTIARQRAAREGKPILIWFTDSARSPMCKLLSTELFARNEFGDWASDKLVRLRVDSAIVFDSSEMGIDEQITRQTEIKSYVKRIKKRYRVGGHPTLVMLNPSGELLWKDSGYRRGQADYIWGLIKQAEVSSKLQYETWRKDLEKKGYREWESRSGKKVFARLISYSKGQLIMIEPGGERYKTHESKLSNRDRRWIEEQKTLHGR